MKKISLRIATLSWAAYTFYLTTIPNFHPSDDSIISWLLSNGGHFFFFGVLAVLLFLSLPTRFWHLDSRIWTVTFTSIYGLAIELLQLNISGRSFGVSDWILDTLGAIMFLAIMEKILIYRLGSKI